MGQKRFPPVRAHLAMGIVILAVCGSSSPAQTSANQSPESRSFQIEGDFALTDHNGRPFHLRQQRGKVALLFFGYTSCAEACPVAMAKMASVYKQLGSLRPRVVTLFVSLDPQRDTPEALAKYLGYFSIGAIGLTGKPEEIDRVVKQYGASYEIEKSDSALGYHINHSTFLYAIAPDGKVRFRFHHTDAPGVIAAAVRELLK
jgi:protein SCO1